MNYKVMQRPMFKLGGGVVKGKKVGNRENFATISEIEDLINERAALREKSYGGIRKMLPFSVLASQMDDIRTIRKPGDILNILSNIGGSQELIGALTKLPSIDLKMKEGELTDKITLAKLQKEKNKKFEFEKRLQIAENIEDAQRKLLAGKSEAEQTEIRKSTPYRNLERRKASVLREMSETDYLLQKAIKDKDYFDIDDAFKQFQEIKQRTGIREGGRVGYQQGTPNPMVMPQPKPQEAVQDRQLDTLMDAAPALEDPNQAKSMGEKDMYNALRRRLPKEISDDVVRLIAYNQEAFADFANISDQSDVESFNQKYNVELVLPVGNQ